MRVVLFLHVRNLATGKVRRTVFPYDIESEAALPAVLNDIDRKLAARGERRHG